MNESLVDVLEGLIQLSEAGTVSISEVEKLVDQSFEGDVEQLVVVASIVLIGIGKVSKSRGNRDHLEILQEMLHIARGQWSGHQRTITQIATSSAGPT